MHPLVEKHEQDARASGEMPKNYSVKIT